MSGIAGRLRATADELLPIGSRTHDEITTIADIIDAETVDLSIGADGEPILPGQTLYDGGGTELFVRSLSLTDDGWSVICETGSSFEPLRSMEPSRLSHERSDSWERIADELEEWCDGADVDACEKPRDLADRIRKLAKKGE